MLTVRKTDRCDYLNNPGSDKPAFTIYFTGCSLRCRGCHNPALQDASYGYPDKAANLFREIDSECIQRHMIDVVLLGGEPLEQDRYQMTALIRKLHDVGYRVWLYTGHEWSDVPDVWKMWLYWAKCGRYDDTQRTGSFPASRNQYVMANSDGIWRRLDYDQQ